MPEKVNEKKSEYSLQETGHADAFCSVTISCYNPFLRYFQNFSTFFTAVTVFLAPYQFFFQSFPNLLHQTSADMVYLMMMLLRTRTSVMVDGVEEKDLMNVRNRYQTSYAFVLDIITFLPLAQLRWPFHKYDKEAFSVNRLSLMLRLHYILYYIDLREKESGSSTLLYRTTKYVFLSFLVIHIAACGWYGLACIRSDGVAITFDLCGSESWIRFLPEIILDKVIDSTNDTDAAFTSEVSFLDNTYVTSLYWASATVTSTGYGDIHAHTVSEKVFAIFTMTIGITVLFGMTMGGMTSMLTNIDARRSSFVHRYQAFQKEVNRMGVSTEVKQLCLNYFDYIWRRWEGEDVFTSGFLDILPECLRARFAEARFDKFLHRADLLNDTEDSFYRNLSLVSKPMIFLENQFIQKSGEISDTMCYLHHGILEVLDDGDDAVVALMHSGKLFGQAMLVFDLPRINSIKCRTNCDIFVLSKEDFRNVISLYPESAGKFLEAARRKCRSPHRVWPMDPPSHQDFHGCLERTDAVRDRLKHFSVFGDKPHSDRPEQPDLRKRRMTTVYSADYSGMNLSRVPFPHDAPHHHFHYRKPSMFNYVVHGDTGRGQRASVFMNDGTELLVTNDNYEIINNAVGSATEQGESDFTTWRSRLFQLTIINPKGRLYRLWLNLLFIVSLVAGLYPTFIAFFTTTPGEQKLYTYTGDDDLFGKDIIYMATDSCNITQNEQYFQCEPWPFNETVECLRRIGGPFAWRVLGNQSSGYQVYLPSRYDISRVAFSSGTQESQVHFLLSILVIDVPFYLNICINFRTEVFTANGFLTSFKDIAGNYNKWNKLWLDIFGILPLEIFAPFFGCSRIVSYHAIAFLRLNRVLYFFRYVPIAFTRWEYSLNVKIVRIRTIKFLVYIYSITHLCACFFYWWSCGYVAQRDVDNIKDKCKFASWAWVFDISYLTNHYEDYVKTMYWASTTMTSAGYGDITASTTTGRVFALLTMILGTVMYGWLVAVIASTVSNSEAAQVEFTNSMLDTKNYLGVNLVQDALIHRVMNVRRIEWERYAGTAIPGKQTIGKELSELLHNVLFFESLNKFVDCLPFFHSVDPAFVAMLCNYIHVFHYSEGDMIIYEGDLSRNLYIIKQGHCIIVSEDLETKLDQLAAGDYFGECEMLFGCASPRTIVAETACELLVLHRDDVDQVLESFPQIQAQMLKVKEDLNYKDRILQALALRNTVYKSPDNSMAVRYKTEFVEGGIKMYTERRHNYSPLSALGERDRTMTLTWLQRLLSLFLLPVGFDPSSLSYVVYETLRSILIVITLVIVPVQFAFVPSSHSTMLLQYSLDGLTLIDQYVKAHTSYFNEQAILVTHPTRTAVHYFRTSFLVDFLSWFPFELIFYGQFDGTMSEQQWRFLAILRVNRVLQMYKIFGYFTFWLSGIRQLNRWLKSFRSLLVGVLIHHWFACLLFVAAIQPTINNYDTEFQSNPDMITLTASGIPSFCSKASWIGQIIVKKEFPALDIIASVSDQYKISFYWATATLVCVGYGDIHSRQPLEMFLATIVMVCGTVYYSYILGGMSANVQTDDTRRAHYKDRLSDIHKFFEVYDVSKETQKQVLNYYCYLWDRTGGVSPDHLFTGLPPSLRTSVCQSMYGPMIREAFDEGTFVDKETQGFFRLLSTHITPALYLKHSIICRRNDIGNEMFFIQRGSVAILDDDEQTPIKVLGPGQHFGEVALLFAVPRSKTVKASTNCELNVLTKKDLDDIFTTFPRFRQRMTAIAQDRTLHGSDSATYEHHTSELALQLGTFSTKDEVVKPTEKKKEKNIFESRVIDKESIFSFVWDNVIVLLSFICSSLCIYQACFFSHNYGIYLWGYFIDLWFAADILLGYHTSFLDQFSTNVDNLKTINLHYAKSPDHFTLDVAASAPIELLSILFAANARLQLSIFSFARLNRMLRMYRLWKIFGRWGKDIRNNVLLVRLYQSVLCVAFTLIFVGSVWYAIACPLGECQELTWTTASTANYAVKRIRCFDLLSWVDSIYWAVATITSTGYGDIKPLTGTEMLYACFVMVLGKLMIGYVLGMVAATLANDESLGVWYKENVSAVKNCMADHKFDKKLTYHVIQYYEYMWMKNKGVNFTTLFPDLSFCLRADIYSQICGEMITGIELFSECPENFIRHLSMVMAPLAYMPGDYICLQGDVRSEMFIIYHGLADIIKHKGREKVVIGQVMEGEEILCESVLCKHRRPYSVRAATYVDAFSMTMDGLQSVLKYHPAVNTAIHEKAGAMFPDLEL